MFEALPGLMRGWRAAARQARRSVAGDVVEIESDAMMVAPPLSGTIGGGYVMIGSTTREDLTAMEEDVIK